MRGVRALLERMTVREKAAQLYAIWMGVDDADGEVAPLQSEAARQGDWQTLIANGVGQLTRPFGSAPVEPAAGARALARAQRQIMAAGRFGIPALVHEECLTGMMAWRATVYPSPLCWGASFDPALIERMAAQIGATMRRLGVHQGLAPVLDVVRDLRWGRVEETIGEDPHLVGLIGSAYVRGLESAGIVSTLKHFAGYSASRAARNLAPVSIGPRELADVLLPPFEMALRAGARSVMPSYTDLDGVPAAADRDLLTRLLREAFEFTGTVVSDYFAVSFLHRLHGVAGSPGEAAGLALAAGIDVELPAVDCYGEPLLAAVADGTVAEDLIDRAAAPGAGPEGRAGPAGPALDARARRASTSSGSLSWTTRPPGRWRWRWPGARSCCCATTASAACRWPPAGASRSSAREPTSPTPCSAATPSRPTSAGSTPTCRWASSVPTVLDALRADPAGYQVSYAQGSPVLGGDDAGIAAAAAGRAGCRRVRRRARRPGRAVRPRHLGRGLRRGRPAAAGPAGGTARRAAGHRHAGGAGAAVRAALRAVPPGRPAGRRGVRILPRRGGRAPPWPTC